MARVAERGYRSIDVDLLPFMMSGGGAYCMTLRLDHRTVVTGHAEAPDSSLAVT